jgi:ribokinase
VVGLCFLDELAVAGCALERGEADRAAQAVATTAGDVPPPARGRDRGRGADDAAEQERLQPSPATLAVHGCDCRAVRLVTFGDLLLDVVVQLAGPLAPGSDVAATTRIGAGGQAANVAAWAAHLGADATLVAVLADDPAGTIVQKEVVGMGTHVHGPRSAGRTGVVVSLVGPDGERALASSPAASESFAPEELDAVWFDGAEALHVSGYPLVRETTQGAAVLATRLARDAGARVSVDVPPWTSLRAFGPVRFRELLDALAPDVVFATEAEWEMLGGAYLPAPLTVLKRGARGITILAPDARLDLAAIPAEVVDATGAGDALAAGFLLGGSLEEAGRRGLEAAAACVAKLGAMP